MSHNNRGFILYILKRLNSDLYCGNNCYQYYKKHFFLFSPFKITESTTGHHNINCTEGNYCRMYQSHAPVQGQ